MKTLLVLRHAKSSWKDLSLADHDRPLNKRGKSDAPKMGTLLKKEDMVPDLIVASTAKRAARTAEIVAENCGYESEIFYTRELYAAWPEAYVEVLSQVTDNHKRVMVVGHNPGMEELVEDLSGEWVRMPTAALAQVELDIELWSELTSETSGNLVNIWRPKELTR
ncbi:MAG: histidine phosphatase family protein [Candidatus Promineifilaceae bacterium]|nr:histidine phosphatase family protein [Candidatus Promineifilaceae bacterium]